MKPKLRMIKVDVERVSNKDLCPWVLNEDFPSEHDRRCGKFDHCEECWEFYTEKEEEEEKEFKPQNPGCKKCKYYSRVTRSVVEPYHLCKHESHLEPNALNGMVPSSCYNFNGILECTHFEEKDNG